MKDAVEQKWKKETNKEQSIDRGKDGGGETKKTSVSLGTSVSCAQSPQGGGWGGGWLVGRTGGGRGEGGLLADEDGAVAVSTECCLTTQERGGEGVGEGWVWGGWVGCA